MLDAASWLPQDGRNRQLEEYDKCCSLSASTSMLFTETGAQT